MGLQNPDSSVQIRLSPPKNKGLRKKSFIFCVCVRKETTPFCNFSCKIRLSVAQLHCSLADTKRCCDKSQMKCFAMKCALGTTMLRLWRKRYTMLLIDLVALWANGLTFNICCYKMKQKVLLEGWWFTNVISLCYSFSFSLTVYFDLPYFCYDNWLF